MKPPADATAAATGSVSPTRGKRSIRPPQIGPRASWVAAWIAVRSSDLREGQAKVAVEDRQVRVGRADGAEVDEVRQEDPASGSHGRLSRAGPAPSGSLSMSRVVPKRTASDRSAGPSTLIELGQASCRRPTETYSTSASGSVASVARIASRSASPDRSPASQHDRAASEGAMEDRRRRPLGRAEVDVPRREREAVRLTHGGAGDHLGRDGQVAGHLADDHHLLGVLLPEVGMVGADQAEQDRDDRGDAVEVAGTRRSLERLGDRADRHDRVEARRVDLGGRRGEDQVDALGLTDREVARLVPRVAA